jgi:hypothetical protein
MNEHNNVAMMLKNACERICVHMAYYSNICIKKITDLTPPILETQQA